MNNTIMYNGIEVQTGSLIFGSGRRLISKCIKCCTKSKISHVGLILIDSFNNLSKKCEISSAVQNKDEKQMFILEAVQPHIRIVSFEDLQKTYNGDLYIKPVKYTEWSENQIEAFKTMYDNSSMFKFVGYPYEKFFSDFIKSAFKKNLFTKHQCKSFFCSELVGLILNKAGVILENPSNVTPDTLYQLDIFYHKDCVWCNYDL